MSKMRYAVIVLLWAASLAVAAEWGLLAQSRGPQVLSGSDLGFRLQGTTPAGRPYGTFVVRINGGWVPVEGMATPDPAIVK